MQGWQAESVNADKVLYEMMMNTVCNSNLLFIKYMYTILYK